MLLVPPLFCSPLYFVVYSLYFLVYFCIRFAFREEHVYFPFHRYFPDLFPHEEYLETTFSFTPMYFTVRVSGCILLRFLFYLCYFIASSNSSKLIGSVPSSLSSVSSLIICLSYSPFSSNFWVSCLWQIFIKLFLLVWMLLKSSFSALLCYHHL